VDKKINYISFKLYFILYNYLHEIGITTSSYLILTLKLKVDKLIF